MASGKKLIELSVEELVEVQRWVRSFNLSKEHRNISRDMADGVLVAEILKQLYPKWVDLHNYTKCCSTRNKLDNWQTLNRKVLRRLDIYLDDEMMCDIVNGKNQMLEVLLFELMARNLMDGHKTYHHEDDEEGSYSKQ